MNPPATCKATVPRSIHNLLYDEPLAFKNEICMMSDASFESDANARLIAAAPTLCDFVIKLAQNGNDEARLTLDSLLIAY